MNNTQLETIEQIQAFLLSNQATDLVIEDKAERYQWIQRMLVQLNCLQLGKSHRQRPSGRSGWYERLVSYSIRSMKSPSLKESRRWRKSPSVVGSRC